MPYFVVIRERGRAWDWSLPMRRQAQWEAHAAFMDTLEDEGFVVAGGPFGGEDPWSDTDLLSTVSIERWTVLVGGFSG